MSRTDIIPGVSIPSALVANLYDKNAEPDDKLAQQVAQEQIIYVIEARGGDDKNVHGHVAGAVATANKIIDAQINSAPIFYAWKDHEEVKATLMQPNVIGAVLMTGTVLPEYSQAKLDGLMAEFKAAGKLVGASIYEAGVPERYSTKLPNPEGAKYKLAVIEFVIPGAKNGGSDKGPDGHRVDSIPIANGIIKAGGSCDLIRYEFDKHDAFAAEVEAFDAVLVRINPGQLSQGTTPGTQQRFDDLMNSLLAKGKLVWSSPGVQTCMGAKDALVKINHMSVGLPDTFAYYEKSELEAGFKKTCAFQPRVIKQNRGSAGEGIWLCWLEGKDYCTNFGDAMLEDDDKLKLMEMNDNHVEYHTVKEFITFCVEGPDAEGAGARARAHATPARRRGCARGRTRTLTNPCPPLYLLVRHPSARPLLPQASGSRPSRASTWRVARRRAGSSSTSGCCRASPRARCAC